MNISKIIVTVLVIFFFFFLFSLLPMFNGSRKRVVRKIKSWIFRKNFDKKKVEEKKIEKINFTNEEKELITNTQFDRDIFILLKNYFGNEVKQFINADTETGEEIKHNALEITGNVDKILEFLSNNEISFRNNGYIPFFGDIYYSKDIKTRNLIILKTYDQFDILRTMQTNRENYGYDKEYILEFLQNFYKEKPFSITGANTDFVQLMTVEPYTPEEAKKYAKVFRKFAPDIVLQGTGTTKALESLLVLEKDLVLWWD